MFFHAAGQVHDSVWCIIKRIQDSLYNLLSWWKAPNVRLVDLPLSPYLMSYQWPQCLWALRNDPTKSGGGGWGLRVPQNTFLGKCQNNFHADCR